MCVERKRLWYRPLNKRICWKLKRRIRMERIERD